MPVHVLSQQMPFTQKPDAQVAPALHTCPLLLLQVPAPSQALPFSQLPGTTVPAAASLQMPSDPGTLHDLHEPVQAAVSQQTPSTQLPDAHKVANVALQPSPLPRLVTLYSQVSLPTSVAKAPDTIPPNNTATPRSLSKAMAVLWREDGALSLRWYHWGIFASSSQVCELSALEASGRRMIRRRMES
jgi:hypothetical protein